MAHKHLVARRPPLGEDACLFSEDIASCSNDVPCSPPAPQPLAPLALPTIALAQRKKDALVLALTLEPTGLDPTAKAGAEIAEVVLYNVFETLTKINSDGSVTPLLAES